VTTPGTEPSVEPITHLQLVDHPRYGTVVLLPDNPPLAAARILGDAGVRLHAGTARGTFPSDLTLHQQHRDADQLLRKLAEAGIECEDLTVRPATLPDRTLAYTDPSHAAPPAARITVTYEDRPAIGPAATALAKQLPGRWSASTLLLTTDWQRARFDDPWIDGALLWSVNDFIHKYAAVLHGPDNLTLLLVAHPAEPEQWIVGTQNPRGPHAPPHPNQLPLSTPIPADTATAASIIADGLLPAVREAVGAANLQPPSPTRITIRYDSEHPAAVRADVTGPEEQVAAIALISAGFTPTPEGLRLARIDGEEEFYAAQAVTELRHLGFEVEADADLDPWAAFDDDWRWGNDDMPWATREEVREVGSAAQQLHDAIATGQLVVHAHAKDSDQPIMLATFVGGQKTVELWGEDRQLTETNAWTDARQALQDFNERWGDGVKPGPPPPTSNELRMAAALARTVRSPVNAHSDTHAPAATSAGHSPQPGGRRH